MLGKKKQTFWAFFGNNLFFGFAKKYVASFEALSEKLFGPSEISTFVLMIHTYRYFWHHKIALYFHTIAVSHLKCLCAGKVQSCRNQLLCGVQLDKKRTFLVAIAIYWLGILRRKRFSNTTPKHDKPIRQHLDFQNKYETKFRYG